MAGETITIECLDDGTYRVTSVEQGGEPGDEPLDQTVKTVDEALALVQRELGDDAQASPAAAWNEEAAGRDSSGYRQPGPPMSM